MSSSFLKNIGAPGVNKPAPPKAKGKTAFEESISSKVQEVKPPTLHQWQQFAPGSGSLDKWDARWTPNGHQVPGTSPDKYDGRGLTDVYGRGIYGKNGKVQSPVRSSKKTEVTTDQETRTNANNVRQTGTNTGAINMPGLEDVDMTGIANFAGPSFPTQPATNRLQFGYSNSNPGFNISPQAEDGSPINIAGLDASVAQVDDYKFNGGTFDATNFRDMGGDYSAFAADNYKVGGRFTGPPTPTQGLESTPKKSAQIGVGVSYDGVGSDDMEFNGPDPLSYASRPGNSAEEMRRRSAFLDAPDSMQGMQNVAAGLGMGNAGIINYANVNGKPVEMSQEERRAILNAAPGKAQALKDDFINRINAAKSEEQVASSTPASLQNPGVNTDMSVGSSLNQIRPEAFDESGPNFGVKATAQPLNVGPVSSFKLNNSESDSGNTGITVGKNKNKVNPSSFTAGLLTNQTYSAQPFSL